MRGQLDLSGEIHEDEEDEIVKIAQKVADERGYAIYEDYEEYLWQRVLEEGLNLANWDIPKIKIEIRGTLLAVGWKSSSGHPETRFYPPGTDLDQLLISLSYKGG